MSVLFLKRVAAVVLPAIILIAETACWGDMSPRPFAPGEKLTFKLRWGLIPAGEATLELLPVEKMDDLPVYHFVMTVRTNAFLDLFYTYRSRIDAYADTSMTHSLRYREKTRIRRKVKEIIVDFDWKTNQARFKRTDTGVSSTSGPRITEHVIPLLAGTFDPLTIYYYTRLLDLNVGDRIEQPISDGVKCVVADAEVVRKESVVANDTIYDTYLVEPDFKGVTPVFEILAGAKILVWMSVEAGRLPIKLASKISLGQFTGELMAVEGLQDNALHPKIQ